uniref:Uncharacterized protein n=1 Tax=Lepeophtheirus salmonis TaxID=72036 RepID=A0A0K2T7X1_LEPSM
MSWELKRLVVLMNMCAGAESCWNMNSLQAAVTFIQGMTNSSMTSQYLIALTFSLGLKKKGGITSPEAGNFVVKTLFGNPPIILDVVASVDSPVLLVGEEDDSSSMASSGH